MFNAVIPTPKKIEELGGKITVPFAICSEKPEWDEHLPVFCAAFEKMFSKNIEIARGGIVIKYDPLLKSSAYTINSENDITVYASDTEGLFYSMATLLMAVSLSDDGITLSKVHVEDYPEKDYRALMVDLAREWHPLHTLYQYIDLCFILKVRYLHLHFIDDQRYTLPSKAFPLLPNPTQSYSAEEIASVCEYAKQRGIIIIPEFEAPGHAGRLVKCYPEIFANDTDASEDDVLITEQGVVITSDNIVCAGNPKTMEAIETLLKEMCEFFPDAPYIHIGGDEANINVWAKCSECRKYMQENGIDGIGDLYSEFVGRVAQIVVDMKKTPIVWEGFPLKGASRIPKETIVIAWESYYQTPQDLIDAGFKIINASWQPLYVVSNIKYRWSAFDILKWNVYNWQHWWNKSKAHLNPINIQPTDELLGAELCAWESTFEQEINLVIENLSALSERTWTVARLWNDSEYYYRFKGTYLRIARLVQEL